MRKMILAFAMILSQQAAAVEFNIPGIGPVDIGPSSKEFTPEELMIDGHPIVIGTMSTPSVEGTEIIDIVCKALFHPRSRVTRATRGWSLEEQTKEIFWAAVPTIGYVKAPNPARPYIKTHGFKLRAQYAEDQVAILKKLTCSKLF